MKKILASISLGLLVSQAYASSPINNQFNSNQDPAQIAQQEVEVPKNKIFLIRNDNFEKNLPKYASEWLSYIKNNNQELECPQTLSGVECSFF